MNAIRLVEQHSPRVARLAAAPAVRQLIRYMVAGLCVTQFAAGVYSAAVLFLGIAPLLANVLSTACGVCAGYLVHSRWSFAGGNGGNEGHQIGRFLLASAIAFLINSTWVWLTTTVMHLSPLAPVPLMILATPWISFLVNRYWVFKVA